ncbi:MAG: hypothetical protein WBJ37_07970 [Bacteroidales bacterium]
MNSSQNKNKDIIYLIYKEKGNVFRFADIAMIVSGQDSASLSRKLNYYIKTGRLLNPRKGIYAKPDYTPEELACTVYVPSYISLQYVLQRAGVIFQYDTRITLVSYLSRIIEVGDKTFLYRKIKGTALVNTTGIERKGLHLNIATPERAFLDMLYLEKEFYFDNPGILRKEMVYKILPVYQSKALTKRVKNILPV